MYSTRDTYRSVEKDPPRMGVYATRSTRRRQCSRQSLFLGHLPLPCHLLHTSQSPIYPTPRPCWISRRHLLHAQTDDKTFLPNLLAMHALLFLPFLTKIAKPSPIPITWTYLGSAAVALLLRVRSGTPPSSINRVEVTPLSLFRDTHIPTLFFNPAQSSIGFDVI